MVLYTRSVKSVVTSSSVVYKEFIKEIGLNECLKSCNKRTRNAYLLTRFKTLREKKKHTLYSIKKKRVLREY